MCSIVSSYACLLPALGSRCTAAHRLIRRCVRSSHDETLTFHFLRLDLSLESLYQPLCSLCSGRSSLFCITQPDWCSSGTSGPHWRPQDESLGVSLTSFFVRRECSSPFDMRSTATHLT